MSEAGATPRRSRFRKVVLSTLGAGVLAIGALAWYVTTDSFQGMVRHRLVAELQRVTGGRVELGSIHTIPFRFQVDVRDLTIHGREAAGEVPYVHLDRLLAEIKLRSALGMELGFKTVVLDRPVIHIIFYADGTTNQPQPKLAAVSGQSLIESLFALSINRLEVRGGEMLWAERKIALDFVANDVSANMQYSFLHRHYLGALLAEKINTRFDDYRPLSWMAETHFILARDSLEVTSLKATSGRSHLQATGKVVNFRHPNISGAYDLSVDVAEAAAISRHPQIRLGVLQASGQGSWSVEKFDLAGKAIATDLDWRDPSLSLHASSLSAGYTISPQRIALSGVEAKLLQGAVSGDAEVTNWLAASAAAKPLNRKGLEPQRGTLRLKLKDISAQEVAAALSSPSRPLRRLNLAGKASGTLETRWAGSLHNAETKIALDVAAPAPVLAGQLPVNVHAHGVYRWARGELEVDDFNASTRATQVRASGTLSQQAAVNLSVTTSDLGEWEPALSAAGYSEEIPLTIRGRASFNGTATGRISEVDFAGKLQSQELETRIPAGPHTPGRVIRWDYMAADVQLSPHALAAHNGTLHHGQTTASFDLTAGLDNRRFTEASPFTANAQIHNASVAEIRDIIGFDFPVDGKLELFLQASGTQAAPQGHGAIHLSQAVIRREPVQRFDSQFSFKGTKFTLDNIQLAQNEARISGSGTYDPSTHAFQTDLTGQNFDLGRIAPLQATRVAIEGSMNFTARGSGTLEEPHLDARISVHDLTFDHEPAGDYILDARTQGSELQISGRSQFKDSELNIDGNIHLRQDWPADVKLHFSKLDVDPLLRTYLRGYVSGHSVLAGDLQLQGPLRKPGELQVMGTINDLDADLDNIPIRNNGAIQFSFANQSLNIQQLRLIGEGTDLTLAGTVQLVGDRKLDLRAAGHTNLELIHSYNPDFISSGQVAVNVSAGGVVARPMIQGRLQVTGGSIQYSDLPSALSDINGALVFDQDRLRVETLTAHVGGGLVSFGGYATAYNRQLSFDLTLRGQDVRLRYPPGVSSMTNTNLRWAGTAAASTFSGDATITKLSVTPGFDFGSYLERSAQAAALPQTNPLLNRIRMDVHLVTTPELQMQTASLRLSGDADLHLRGTAAKPVLLGRADVIEGEVYFNGAKYRMERGDILFTNPVTTTPVLDLQASTRVREYDVTVNLNGALEKLNLSYHSEPPLPSADIISLLALGQTQEQSAQMQQAGQSSFAQQASSAVLAEALNSAISSRSQRLFGISHIKIDPQGLNTETTPTQTTPFPAVTIEQQVRDNITLTYTTDVTQTSQQIIQGEYNITRDLSIVGLRDYNGVVSFEVRLRRRKK